MKTKKNNNKKPSARSTLITRGLGENQKLKKPPSCLPHACHLQA
jgi:hypothetical protein